jgi:hypothetical protein
MQALGEGPRQRRRMDAAKPRILNFLHSILNSAFVPASQAPPLRGGCIPSPLGCPFLQGGTGLPTSSICMITYRMPLFAAKPLDLNSLHSILNSFPIMQTLGEGPRQRCRMDWRKVAEGERPAGEVTQGERPSAEGKEAARKVQKRRLMKSDRGCAAGPV